MNMSLSSQKYGLEIRDPEKIYPGSRVKKAPDLESGTLDIFQYFIFCFYELYAFLDPNPFNTFYKHKCCIFKLLIMTIKRGFMLTIFCQRISLLTVSKLFRQINSNGTRNLFFP
jgi:hypothetical protein